MPFDDIVLPNMAPGESLGINEALRALESRVSVLEGSTMRIIQNYEHGQCYRAGDVVRVDDSYTMVYVRDSCDSPRIEVVDDFEWVTGETDPPSLLTWQKGAFSTTVKWRANEFRLLGGRSYYIQRARLYVPHNANTQDYTVFHQRLVPQTGEWVTDIISQNILSTEEGTWLPVPYSALWLRNEYHRMGVGIRALSSTTTWSGYWAQKNQNGTPGEGELNFYNNQVRMRVHHVDKNDVNHQTALEATPEGATITRGSDTWTITNIREQAGSYVDWDIQPGGQRGSENEYTFGFEYGTAEPLYHYQVSDLWFAEPNILGVWRNGTDPENESSHQYMVDVEFAEVNVSPDVAVVSLA